MTQPAAASWRRLPSHRLKRGGPRASGAASAVRLIAGAAAALGLCWLLFAALSPLPTAPGESPAPLATVPAITPRTADLDARRRLVDRLASGNPFSHGRKPWSDAPTAPALAGDPQPVAVPGSGAAPAPPPMPLADLPEDVRKAGEGVELKQIYTTRSGELVARIGFVHSPDRSVTRPVRAGEQFTDEPAGNTWTLTEIDPARNRVILQRGRHALTLWLYGAQRPDEQANPASAAASAAEASAQAEPQVIPRTRDQIISDLREADVPERDIIELLKLIDKPADQPPQAGKRQPPAGLEGVLRLMAQPQKDAEKSAPPAPGHQD